MEIRYLNRREIDPQKLRDLWTKIGWGVEENSFQRPDTVWNEIIGRSASVISAWDQDQLVGFGRLVDDTVMCMLYDIAVDPDYQGKGIGKRIVSELINPIKGKRASIGLFAWEENPNNIPFYESLGFEKSSGMEAIHYMKPE